YVQGGERPDARDGRRRRSWRWRHAPRRRQARPAAAATVHDDGAGAAGRRRRRRDLAGGGGGGGQGEDGRRRPDHAALPHAIRRRLHVTPSVPATAPTAPLTIVYGGQVLVFEHYTAEAAEKLVQRTQHLTPPPDEPPMLLPPPQMPAASGVSAGGVMPIARKASLQRFLQKRKQK
ncbi:Os03g0396500, partial [Oryza sativa Japonica Group]